MLPLRHTTRALATIVAIVALAGVPAAAEAQGHHSTSVVRLTAKSTSGHRFDMTATDHVAGDVTRFTDDLRLNGRNAGSDSGTCSYSDPIYFTCSLTLSLRGGTVRVSIPSGDMMGDVTAPIAAGTGRYAGARGQLVITNAVKSVARYELTYTN